MSAELENTLNTIKISRRDFLKIGLANLSALAFTPSFDISNITIEQQGRIIDPSIKLYDIPSRDGNAIKTLWKDMVLPITEVTIGKGEPEYNRVWYQINSEGYVHSGPVQPVRTKLTEPIANIQKGATWPKSQCPLLTRIGGQTLISPLHTGCIMKQHIGWRGWYTTIMEIHGTAFWTTNGRSAITPQLGICALCQIAS